MDKKLKSLIDRCQVVSFDIFDTLIFRKCTHPTDVFDDVALQLEIESAIFKEDRI